MQKGDIVELWDRSGSIAVVNRNGVLQTVPGYPQKEFPCTDKMEQEGYSREDVRYEVVDLDHEWPVAAQTETQRQKFETEGPNHIVLRNVKNPGAGLIMTRSRFVARGIPTVAFPDPPKTAKARRELAKKLGWSE